VALFSRSLFGVIMCALGVLVSLETRSAMDRGERWWLIAFGSYMTLTCGVSIGLGALTLAGVDTNCAGAFAPDACTSLGIVTGLVLAIGSSSAGLFAAICAWLAYVGWGGEGGGGGRVKRDKLIVGGERRKLGD
jgi:hypothetical protein